MTGLNLAIVTAVLYILQSKLYVDGQSLTLTFTKSSKTKSSNHCEYDLEERVANCTSRQLYEVPDQLIHDVQRLYLSYNYIERLPNISFQRYSMLIELDLSYNNIMLIEPGAFYPLKRLQRLYVNGNSNLLLPSADIFLFFEDLTVLSLSDCNLTFFPDRIIMYLPRLEELSLSYNELSSINLTLCPVGELQSLDLTSNHFENLSEETFTLSCKCRSISIGRNSIKSINPDLFSFSFVQELTLTGNNFSSETWSHLFKGIGHSTIQKLVVQHGNLRDIPVDFFTPLGDHRLHTLDLSFNNIHILHPFGFQNMSVCNLSLSNNHIEQIEPEYFSGMIGLVTINLDNNFITIINPYKSMWNLNLENMILSNNKLGDINYYAFNGLKNLRMLDLQNNKFLIKLQFTSLSGVDNLEMLDVSGSSMSSLSLFAPRLKSFSIQTFTFWLYTFVPGETFRYTKAIEKINITHSLSVFDFRDEEKNTYLFDGLGNLTHLVLSDNNFQYLPTGAFYQLSSLESLDLRRCLTLVIYKDAFVGLTALRTLKLQHNNLQSPPILAVFSKLTQLFLHDNSLGYLENNEFANNSLLKELTLANNLFKGFNQTTIAALNASAVSIDISGNPFDCNCELVWFVEWLKGPVNVVNKQHILCSSTNVTLRELRGKNIAMFEASRWCGPDASIYSAIPVTIIALSLITVTVYYHRWFLRYNIFLLRMAILGYQEIHNGGEQGGFEFDLNVMFNDDDEDWVREHLRPALEDRLPQFERNAIGDDALMLGMHYLEAVQHVVENSFKTVLLISRAAVCENWFLIKFRIALDHVENVQAENIIVIFLEDIPDEDIPYLVRLYLSARRPYLRWTEDGRGREYFWNELVKNLTVNLIDGGFHHAE